MSTSDQKILNIFKSHHFLKPMKGPQDWLKANRTGNLTVSTVNPKHMNFQVANFLRCKHAFIPSVSSVNEIVACPPSPIADDPSALPSLTSSLSSSQ